MKINRARAEIDECKSVLKLQLVPWMIPRPINVQIFSSSSCVWICSGLHSAATWQKPSSKLFLGLNKWSGNRVLKEPLTSSPFTRYLSKLLLSVRLSWRFDYIIQPPCRLAASGRHQCLRELQQQQLTLSSFPKKNAAQPEFRTRLTR